VTAKAKSQPYWKKKASLCSCTTEIFQPHENTQKDKSGNLKRKWGPEASDWPLASGYQPLAGGHLGPPGLRQVVTRPQSHIESYFTGKISN
jgi:hypothetical protein